ncbi:MAG: lamin tail domain-containing protein [Planctomycetes bacterium]|nr:lamin tail domain-containing protein [Planctomycetota bacterium]
MRTIKTLTLLVLLAGLVPAQGVVINECFLGVPDYCEIANFGPSAVSIAGWTLIMTDDPTVVTTFVFPANTVLQPGEIAVVAESTTAPTVPVGVQRFVTSNINWAQGSGGTAALNDNANVGQDYVVFGNATNIPGGNPLSPFSGSVNPATNVLARNGLIDTNTAADWTADPNGSETPGTLHPSQQTPDTGQANGALARLDINGGTNINGQAADNGVNGPFFATGSPMNITIQGQANQIWILLLGPLNRANAVFPGVGQLDIGLLGAGNPGDIQLILSGAGVGTFDQFANTGPTGSSTLTLGVSSLPPGVIGAFQAIVYNTTSSIVQITAAFEYTVP